MKSCEWTAQMTSKTPFKSGYMRRINENGKLLNKDCKGPVKVTLR